MSSDLKQLLQTVGINAPRANYLWHIDDVRKLAYVETPKVACTSIKKFMMDQYHGAVFPLSNNSQVHDRNISPLKQLFSMPAQDAENVIFGAQYRRFSFVRNPFSRLLSGYLDKLVNNDYERRRHLPLMGFELGSHPTLLEFLGRLKLQNDTERDVHFATQSSLLEVDTVTYDYIGRFEGFRQNFQDFQSDFYGVGPATDSYETFGKHHASDANSKVLAHYGDAEVALVREIYAKDFALFGYSEDIAKVNEPVPPVQLETLQAEACKIALGSDLESAQLAQCLRRYLTLLEARGPADAHDLPVNILTRAFQKLGEYGKLEDILALDTDFPATVRLMPVAGIQVAKAMTARGAHDDAGRYLAALRTAHPAMPVVWLQSAENAYRREAPEEAADYFKRLSSFDKLPKWMFRPYMALCMAYCRWSPEKGANLAQNVFLDEDFIHDDSHERFASVLFMADLFKNKPVDHGLLAKIRKALAESREPDTETGIVSRFVLEGSQFKLTPERRKTLISVLGGKPRSVVIPILHWWTHPLSNFKIDDDKIAFLREISDMQKTQGRDTMALMLRIVAGDNMSNALSGAKISLGRKRKPLKRKLKVALCVSGQLRGYESSFPTWKDSALFKDADVSVFVSSWHQVGRKFPIPPHADRTFSGSFLNTYRETWARIGAREGISQKYPAFTALLEDSAQVRREDLIDVFQTESIELINDADDQFIDFTNQEKMFFHIGNAYRMAARTKNRFDLFMRLRPDLEYFKPKNFRWTEILDQSYQTGTFFTDHAFKVSDPHGLFVGDQVSLGRKKSFEHYCSIFSKLRTPHKDSVITLDGGPKPHSTFGYHLAAGGIVPVSFQAASPPNLLDPSPVLPDAIAEALARDVPPDRRSSDPLWCAIQTDLGEATP
jgi:Sulfotransferase family